MSIGTKTEHEFVTASEVADYLRIDEQTVRLWARQGRIPAVRLSPKAIRFRLPDVMAALGVTAS